MIIKEFLKKEGGGGFRIVIRENAYGSMLDKFEKLFQVAKEDFPNLSSSDVEVIHFGGRYYAKTFGIEFDAKTYPEGYSQVSNLEYRL